MEGKSKLLEKLEQEIESSEEYTLISVTSIPSESISKPSVPGAGLV